MAVITIARPFGAGGHTLGKLVAKRLGYELIEEEMVNAVAEKARVSPDWVRSIEAERGNALLNFFHGLVSPSFLDRLLDDQGKGHMDENIYQDVLKEVMEEIAREGNAVIIGRGGQYMLHETRGVRHVLLTSDHEHRVSFLMERYDMSEERAEQVIRRGDKRRTNFYKRLKHKDYDDPQLYDLVINTSRVSLERAEDIITRLVADLTCEVSD